MLDIFHKKILEFQLKVCTTQQSANAPISRNVDGDDQPQQIGAEYLQEAVEFINENIVDFRNAHNQILFLPILHHIMQNLNTNTVQRALDQLIGKWLISHADNERDLNCVLNFLYEILQCIQGCTLPEAAEPCHHEVGKTLVKILLTEPSAHVEQARVRCANILTCLNAYLRHFAAVDIIVELRRIIAAANKTDNCELKSQILVYLFDHFQRHASDFHADECLAGITRRLLSSELREQRKVAYFLLKKTLEALRKQPNSQQQLQQQWTAYITVLENLEENQTHLIMPSLSALAAIAFPQDSWHEWLSILYKRLLSHNNILIVRWALEDFLQRNANRALKLAQLIELMDAFNNTHLYNYEGYFLPAVHVQAFMAAQREDLILKALVQVRWKSVPLHFWLLHWQRHVESLAGQPQAGTSQRGDLLLKLASRVRMLQCPPIRQRVVKLVEAVFARDIAGMTLNEYAILVETLYNVSDASNKLIDFEWPDTLKAKLLQSVGQAAMPTFSRRFCEIVATRRFEASSSLADALIDTLQAMPAEQHAWARFLVLFDLPQTEKVRHFCATRYGVSHAELANMESKQIAEYLTLNLACEKDEEKLVFERAIDFYAANLQNLGDLIDDDQRIAHLQENGTHRTLLCLARLLAALQPIDTLDGKDERLLGHFLRALERHLKKPLCDVHREVGLHLMQHFRSPKVAEQLLALDGENLDIAEVVLQSGIPLPVSSYVRGLLCGEASCGEARIEELYQLQQFQVQPLHLRMRGLYARHLERSQIARVAQELLAVHKSYSCRRKKVRYFENSKEHREKLRIAAALVRIEENYGPQSFWSDDLWDILLLENNQLNVSYMYEYLIAKVARNALGIHQQLDRVPSYTASQQVAVIAVVHAHVLLNMNTASQQSDVEAVLHKLLPLTMGANFQTRLYSQLIILSVCRQCQWLSAFLVPVREALRVALGDVLDELLEDIRLKVAVCNLPPQTTRWSLSDVIMYVTNSPYDEFSSSASAPADLYKDFRVSKGLFGKKTCSVMKTGSTVVCPAVGDPVVSSPPEEHSNILVQRKMNPTSDVMWLNSLPSLAKPTKSELYVVASLIDKLPNLGGIARTCEVLGIYNLVVDSSACADKTEFQNLSKTAEKGLNIIEVKAQALIGFLRLKQMEGYKIVGAEQTANSVNFANFKFPLKTVLLLGHEKEGIAPHLLGFLDYAVEIPQFGLVRSLNVHVTGALFMWEYCKQHLIDGTGH